MPRVRDKEKVQVYNRSYYEKTKSIHNPSRAVTRKNLVVVNKEWIKTYKNNHPCVDCGVQYPHYVMQFDHLRDKRWNVSAMSPMSMSKILAEIEKCEIVCGNCHAERTHGNNGSLV